MKKRQGSTPDITLNPRGDPVAVVGGKPYNMIKIYSKAILYLQTKKRYINKK